MKPWLLHANLEITGPKEGETEQRVKYSKWSPLLYSVPGRPKKLMLPGFGGHWVVGSHYHLCLEPKIIVSSELTSFKSKNKRSVEPNPRNYTQRKKKSAWKLRIHTFSPWNLEHHLNQISNHHFSGSQPFIFRAGWSTVESKIPWFFAADCCSQKLGTRNRQSLEKVTKVRVFWRVDKLESVWNGWFQLVVINLDFIK